jgi:hypothetical protein
MKLFFLSVLFLIFSYSIIFADEFSEFLDNNSEKVLVIRLKNGDMITGIVEYISDDKTKEGTFRIKTQIGTTIIYFSEVKEIQIKDDLNRQRHRCFIMPTAEPIGKNHFISNYMIALFYAGFGIYDYVSVTAGTSLIPTVDSRDQISLINVKATVYSMDWETMKGGMSIALGANLAFVNNKNKFSHLYGNITLRGDRTDLTALVFVKTGEEDFYDLRFVDRVYPAIYFNNAFGLGLGMTTKFSERHDLYFVGEIWNTDISRLTNTGLLGAIRIQNSSFSADFGLMFFTVPALFPVVNFSWTPF